MAERICRHGFCHSSLARGIGGLDFRAQRCFERSVFHAHARRLCALSEPAVAWSVCHDGDLLRSRIDVQADDCDNAVCSIVARLLAAPTPGELSRFATVDRGEDSSFCPFRHFVCGHDARAEARRRFGRGIATRFAHQQHFCRVGHILMANDLACAASGFLFPPGKHVAISASRVGNRFARALHHNCDPAAAQMPLPGYGLVLVFGNAGSRDRIDSGREPGACRSLHLFASDRPLPDGNVVGRGCISRLATSAKNFSVVRCDCDCCPGLVWMETNFLLAR